MTKLLVISANPNTSDTSFGLAAGKAFLDSYRTANPGDQVTEVNLFDIYVPELDRQMFKALAALANGESFDSLDSEQQKAIIASDALLKQFIEHDKYLFITPLWNACFPARFKSYLDALCVPQKTFMYTEEGYPKGLIEGNRKAIHIHAGGSFLRGSNQADSVLREVMHLIGIPEIETLYIQGHGQKPELSDKIKEIAKERASEMAKHF